MTEIKQKERINYLDVLRVLACFLVVLCHAGDKYVVAADGTFHTGWMKILVFTRPCVPLFILLSGTLLLPLKYDTKEFFKRRFSRILIPFLVWSILYVFFPLPGTPVFGGPGNAFTGEMNLYAYNLMMIPMNFTKSNVHFWFIYTIIGLYLFMPIVSPWIKQTTQRGMTWFLLAWGITLFLPYIKLWFPQVWGVCDWNEFGMFYNFGGYLGFIVLGIYLHRYNKLSAVKSALIGIALFVIGFVLTYQGMLFDISRLNSHIVDKVNDEGWKIIENSIGYMTINVALMTAGTFMIFQKLNFPGKVAAFFAELSQKSYGLFLAHYIISLWLCPLLFGKITDLREVEQVIVSLIIVFASYAVAKALSYLPKSKYLIG